ncbi:MAG TPA: hypothetical protein VIK97_01880 [Casimicrobiaceae bacterium]
MTTLWEGLERPHERGLGQPLRRGRDGTFRQAADGLIVRVAAAESVADVRQQHRALLDLAVRDAVEQVDGGTTAAQPVAESPTAANRTAIFAARVEGNAGRTGL